MLLLKLDKKLNQLEDRFIEEKVTKEVFLKYSEKGKAERLQIEKKCKDKK
ncbi:MAG: hypothetical protein ICV66_06495 [Chitinophagaceae bacterium]|nr:hypothetical protein [Chitinophagaceae bacterium]